MSHNDPAESVLPHYTDAELRQRFEVAGPKLKQLKSKKSGPCLYVEELFVLIMHLPHNKHPFLPQKVLNKSWSYSTSGMVFALHVVNPGSGPWGPVGIFHEYRARSKYWAQPNVAPKQTNKIRCTKCAN